MSFHVKRLGAAALALSLALGAGAASAQTTPAKPAAPAAPAPAAPAAPGQPAAGAPPQPPSKVDLVSPEPQWVKLCGKEPTTGKDACQVERAFGPSADQPPIVSIQVFELQGEERRKLRLMLPVGTLLKPGFRVIIDKGDPIEGKYELCAPNACISEIDIGAATLAAIKKGQTMSLVVRVPAPGDPSGRELTLTAPIKEFAAAYDGKATDPKLLEQQRQQLQQQLQKKAEEQRKLLEQQQQQSGAAAPAPAAPAPAPAPAAAPKQ